MLQKLVAMWKTNLQVHKMKIHCPFEEKPVTSAWDGVR